MRKPIICFTNRSDTNGAVQAQMARGLKIWKSEDFNLEEGLYYPCSENNCGTFFHNFHEEVTTQLICVSFFGICILLVFW